MYQLNDTHFFQLPDITLNETHSAIHSESIIVNFSTRK